MTPIRYTPPRAAATVSPWTNPTPLTWPPTAASTAVAVQRVAADRNRVELAVVAAVAGLPWVGLALLWELGVDTDRDIANLVPLAVLVALEATAPGTPDRVAIGDDARRLLVAIDCWDADDHRPDTSDTTKIGPEALATLLAHPFDRGAVVLAATRLQDVNLRQRAAIAVAAFWAAEAGVAIDHVQRP